MTSSEGDLALSREADGKHDDIGGGNSLQICAALSSSSSCDFSSTEDALEASYVRKQISKVIWRRLH